MTSAGSIIHELGQGLRHHFSVMELFKAGSKGKKTDIESSDYDLVLYLSKTKRQSLSEILMKKLVEKVANVLQTHLGHLNIRNLHCTPYAVQFEATRGSTTVKIDLLPTAAHEVQKYGNSYWPLVWKEIQQFSWRRKHVFSSHFAKKAVQFMRDALRNSKPHVREFIRKVKKKREEHNNKGNPRAYILELITLHVNEKYNPKDIQSLAYLALEAVEDFENIHIILNKDGNYRKYIPKTLKSKKPLILDVANPYNNLVFKYTRADKLALKKVMKRMNDEVSRTNKNQKASTAITTAQNALKKYQKTGAVQAFEITTKVSLKVNGQGNVKTWQDYGSAISEYLNKINDDQRLEGARTAVSETIFRSHYAKFPFWPGVGKAQSATISVNCEGNSMYQKATILWRCSGSVTVTDMQPVQGSFMARFSGRPTIQVLHIREDVANLLGYY
mmetsp:Transcript_11139/g.12260  ORF Transcript_11139/g.12260 Transcript_11139/m.12260 type:complete len:444 (-) Transcript_11139:643-1974(-)